jgi:oligopeptidase B
MRPAVAILLLVTMNQTVLEAAEAAKPPVAKKVPKELKAFGDTRQDPYFWMRYKDEDPAVLEYVKEENAYMEAVMKPMEPLVEKVYQEIIGRIKQTDESLPYRQGSYFYYTKTEEGKQYYVSARKKGSLDAAEEVLLDVNEMAKPHKFFSVGTQTISPDEKLLAYATDTTGYREYVLRVKNLETGQDLPDEITRISGAVWAMDGKTLIYSKQQEKTKRQYQIWAHELGKPVSEDKLLFEEKDEKFSAGMGRSLSKEYLFFGAQSGLTSEYFYVSAKTPLAKPQPLAPRREGITYDVDHHGEHFYIRINDKGRNFRLVKAPVQDPSEKNWVEVIPASNDVYVEEMLFLKNYAVFQLRVNGLHTLRVMDLPSGKTHDIKFDEQAYVLGIGVNREFDSEVLRFGYSSMTTPQSTYDYNLRTRERKLMKQQEVLGGYDPSQYAVERIFITSHDGVKVPVTIAYKKGFEKNGKAPMLLYGYGSYAIPMDPGFSSSRLSLLDRGFAYAIAHIRGGTDMGYTWYEAGKLRTKKNTFRDFVAAAEQLVAQKYTSPDRLVIEGASAGGLLVGAAANMRPDLFKTVIAGVPFVDVVSSLQDKTIPLSYTDADEFGDPEKQEYYEYMKSYSPYDNVAKAKYPNMYIFSGINDSQVPYWEPLKWTAKLRDNQQGDGLIVLYMNTDAGHGGASGRYSRLKELARSYAFALWTVGIRE